MNINSEKIALALFVFSVLALSFLVVTSFKGGIAGKAVENIEEKAVGVTGCADSDNGRNYGIKGIAEGEEDYCSGKILTEFYCENNEKKQEEHQCEVDCDSGACASSVKKYSYSNVISGGGGGESTGVAGEATVAVATGQTYDIGELNSENTLDVAKGDAIKMKVSGKDYLIRLQDSTNSHATIGLENGLVFDIGAGEEKDIDLNGDNIAELHLKIRAISTITGKIKITLNPAF